MPFPVYYLALQKSHKIAPLAYATSKTTTKLWHILRVTLKPAFN